MALDGEAPGRHDNSWVFVTLTMLESQVMVMRMCRYQSSAVWQPVLFDREGGWYD
jgi:hypothetical protein